MRSFEFHRPQSVADAVSACCRPATTAKFLAGGQSLLPVLKLDLAQPVDLVSLAGDRRAQGDPLGRRSPGDRRAHHPRRGRDSPEVRQRIPALAGLAAGIGDAAGPEPRHDRRLARPRRSRRRLSGGRARPRRHDRDRPPAASRPTTSSPASSLRRSRRTRSSPPSTSRCRRSAAYAKFRHPASKYAVVGVMVAKTGGRRARRRDRSRLQGVPCPRVEAALAGSFSPDAVAGRDRPPEDLRSGGEASAEYLAHLVTVMAKRAVQACRVTWTCRVTSRTPGGCSHRGATSPTRAWPPPSSWP